jgi:hypothetical protein
MSLVRFFAHPAASPGQDLPRQPYLARCGVETNGHKAQETSPELTAHAATKFVRVEMEPGSIVAIECRPPNRAVEADALSPRYSGTTTFEVGPGWSFSLLEIA